MKIRTYLAIAILGCLFAGYLVDYVLSSHYSKSYRMNNSANHTLMWQKDLDRVVSDTAQFLVSVDLILGADKGYLLKGAQAKARVIGSTLRTLGAREEAPQGLAASVNLSEQQLTKLTTVLQQSATVGDTNREQKLNALLMQADTLSVELGRRLHLLKERTHFAANSIQLQARIAEKEAGLVRVMAILLFSGFVLALWLWANRQISRPIYNLIDEAMAAEHTGHFKSLDKGSKEVLELSEHASRLTNTLSYQATHDALTSLANRRQFERILEHNAMLANDRGISDTHVLCFIDLDHFKIVNDSCGHAAGDELLVQVAVLLQKNVRKADKVARLGGDEFALLLSGCDTATATEICNKVRNAILDIRYSWEDRVYRISASIGITEIDFADNSIESIVNAADTACKVAKDAGRDRVHVFALNDRMLAQKRHEMLYVNQINAAVDDNRFELHRQFIIPLQPNPPAGMHFEVLVRMVTKEGKLIFPNDFLPVVERYQLGAKVDRWIIGTMIDWLLARPDELGKLSTCAINLSGQTLASKDVRNFIEQRLHETGFPPEKLCFEITETAAITDIEYAKEFISDLRELGCRFALDDFGSGLSSYAYLKSLEVDVIKIDGAFVRDMTEDKVNYATVKSINEVAKAVGKSTVAEFVEDAKIAAALTDLGVDYAQGYHFSKPEKLPAPISNTQLKAS